MGGRPRRSRANWRDPQVEEAGLVAEEPGLGDEVALPRVGALAITKRLQLAPLDVPVATVREPAVAGVVEELRKANPVHEAEDRVGAAAPSPCA